MAKLYTEEQIALANSVNLVDFLRMQGEKLIKSGKDMRWERHSSITVRDNKYHNWKEYSGGYPIQFLKEFYGYDFKQAMEVLLSSVGDVELVNSLNQREDIKKPFIVPEKNDSNKRAYAYLNKTRLIDKDILNYFFNHGLIYEDRKYHNAVFVGLDEDGIIRHAHKRSTIPNGKSYRGNVESSDSRYPFHFNGTSDKVFVFEAPIDMLSYMTLHKEHWQEHSYIATNGLGAEGLLHMLEVNQNLKSISLCFDNDIGGVEGAERVFDVLFEKGIYEVEIIQPKNKDFNEDLKEINGLNVLPAVDNPKYHETDALIGELKESIVFENLQKQVDYQSLAKSFASLYYSYNSQGSNDFNDICQKANKFMKMVLIAQHHEANHAIPFYRESEVFDNLTKDYRAYRDNDGNLKKKFSIIIDDLKNIKDGNVSVQSYRKLAVDTLYLRMSTGRELVRNMKLEQEQITGIKDNMKPKAEIIGADGNIFNIMAIASRSLKKEGYGKQAQEMFERVTNSKSYDEALAIVVEYVEPVEQTIEQSDNEMNMKGY